MIKPLNRKTFQALIALHPSNYVNKLTTCQNKFNNLSSIFYLKKVLFSLRHHSINFLHQSIYQSTFPLIFDPYSRRNLIILAVLGLGNEVKIDKKVLISFFRFSGSLIIEETLEKI